MVPGSTFAPFFWTGRVICHFCLTALTGYLIALWTVIILVRKTQKHGENVWLAKHVRSLPFGPLFFQEGLYFDCGLCLQSFWASEEVVGLTCSEVHVYHSECLQKYIHETPTELVCVLCNAHL